MRRPPARQAAIYFGDETDPVAPPVVTKPSAPPVRDPLAPAPQPGPLPRNVGDRFTCWVCKKEKIAEKGVHVWWIQYGNERTSGHVRAVVCSKKCDRKVPYCVNCGIHGHEHGDGPERCPRWYKGPRNRALPLYKCFAHRIVERHKVDVAQGWRPSSTHDTLARMLIKHGGDFGAVRAEISSAYVSPGEADEFGNALIRVFEQAERDDPDYGVEYPRDTPEQIVARAKLSVAQHRDRLSRQGRSLDGHMSEADALSVIADKMAKTGAIQRAIDAYGARASTPDAERVLVPLLSREDSPIRASAAWALFTHRTERVRAAMLVRADVEDVPLLKAYLEQLGEQP